MLQGCLLGLLKGLADMMLMLGFGSEGMAARSAFKKNNSLLRGLMFLLCSSTFFLGIMAVVSYSAFPNDFSKCLLLAATPAVLYALWVIYARISVKPLVAAYRQQVADQEEKMVSFKKNGGWECRSCGRLNQSTDIFCKDCGEYR